MGVASIVKHSTLSLGGAMGLNALLRRRLKHTLVILCYHGVVSEDHHENGYRFRNTVSVKELQWQLENIAKHFTPITGWELIDWLEGKRDLPPFPVFITFDDGFRNNLTLGAPLLTRMGVPALVCLSTNYIGKSAILWPQELNERVLNWPYNTIPIPGSSVEVDVPTEAGARIPVADTIRRKCKQLSNAERENYMDKIRITNLEFTNHDDKELYEFLNWDEVRTLHKLGINIGSHTVTHPILSRLTDEDLHWELLESKNTIERELEAECPWIVYPNGGRDDVSPSVFSMAQQVGYKVGFTLTGKMYADRKEPFSLDRVTIPGHLPGYVFHSRISGLYSLLQ